MKVIIQNTHKPRRDNNLTSLKLAQYTKQQLGPLSDHLMYHMYANEQRCLKTLQVIIPCILQMIY